MKKKSSPSRPTCVFCGASHGAQFVMMNPRFKPFGTTCVACEESLPASTVLPATPAAPKDPPVTEWLDDCTQAFASVAKETLVDVVRPSTGLSWCYGKDLATVRQDYPDAELVNIVEW